MSKAIVAILNSRTQAELVIDRLQTQAAVPIANISVLVPDSSGVHDVGHVKATKVPEGTTAGVVTGGLTGGVLGLLAGIGVIALPGLGALVAAGPIMGALSGAAAGATAGGVVGALVGLGIPEYEAKAYEDKLKSGSFLVAVHDVEGDQASKVKDLLKDADAQDISSVSEKDAD